MRIRSENFKGSCFCVLVQGFKTLSSSAEEIHLIVFFRTARADNFHLLLDFPCLKNAM